MKPLIPVVGALTLTLALPTAVDAQDRGNGRGQQQAREDGDRERGRDRVQRTERRADRKADRAEARERVRAVRQDRREENHDRRAEARRDRREDNEDRRRARAADAGRLREIRQDRDDDRVRRRIAEARRDARVRDARRAVRSADQPRVVFFRRAPDRGLIAGCPPGLARKNNGCLPPGQARRIARSRDFARYDYVWNWRDDDYRYRYDDGYLYRLSPRGSVAGYLPVLGGALGLGQVWPTQYAWQPVPAYYADYYRLPDRYAYRYADGVMYGLDPETQAIGQVAALLTGQTWNVGQAMPAGYEVYNVPYAYRGQYYDTPERLYRYNDGYVYQVDPTTQIVQAVIQLLT